MIIKAYNEISFDSQIEQAKVPVWTSPQIDDASEAALSMLRMASIIAKNRGFDTQVSHLDMASDGSDGMYDIAVGTIDSWDEFQKSGLGEFLPDIDKGWFRKMERAAIVHVTFNVEGSEKELKDLARLLKH